MITTLPEKWISDNMVSKETKRVYDHVSDEEKALCLKHTDPHQFYEAFKAAFPKSKKGPLQIGKIWARRTHFKKEQAESIGLSGQHTEPAGGGRLPSECEEILSRGNNLVAELLQLGKETRQELPDLIDTINDIGTHQRLTFALLTSLAGNKAPEWAKKRTELILSTEGIFPDSDNEGGRSP